MSGKSNQRKVSYLRWSIVLILSVALIGGAYWKFKPQSDTDHNQNILVVIRGDIEENVTAQGKLEPKEYVDVGAQVTGQLQKLYVDIGDNVTAGQLLAEIDPRVYAARVRADEANIKNLRAQLAGQQAETVFARQQYERNRELMKSKGVSQQDFQNSDFTLKKAVATAESIQAQIEQVESALSGNRTSLGYTKIYAPIDGTVVTRVARLGQTLNANQTTPMIMQIAKLDAMTVRAQVAEADIMRLKPEMPVYFSTLGAGERRWHGTVRQILPSPEVINNVVLYNVLVDVDNRDRQLMSGMSTQIFFVLGKAEQVPLIPAAALGQRQPKSDSDKGQAHKVKVVTNDGIQEKIVHIGLQNRRFAELRDGLPVGSRVVSLLPMNGKANGKKNTSSYPMAGAPKL
ncbi:MAG: efflux RND transporter periplasmic adaptor subunit [Gammaproteobacteria bacterium]